METLIITSLLIIILLLLHDKIVIKKSPSPTIKNQTNIKKPYPIIGETKTSVRHPETISSSTGQKEEPGFDPFNLDIEYDIRENVHLQNPQEEPEYGFNSSLDFTEEEEEWNKYRIIDENDGFAQGATFEELSAVQMILQQKVGDPSEKETAAAAVQKIYGTELFILLENSMENASQIIAELLDNSFTHAEETGSSTLRTDDMKDFNIENFT